MKKIISIITVFILIFLAISVFFNITYPLSYEYFIIKYSDEYEVDPYLVAAIINVESKYDKYAESNKGARGLMQIMPATGEWAAEEIGIEDFAVEMLYEPETNIRIGTWYLNTLSAEFDNNLQLVLAAYNSGSGNVNKWLKNERYSEDGNSLEVIPFPETEEYVEKVNKNIKTYNILHKNGFNEESLGRENNSVQLINNFRKVIRHLAIYK